MGKLKPLEASYPLELVHMDYLKIGGKDDPNSNVLMITDHFTQYSQAYVTTNKQAATAARVFVKEFVCNYGWPTKILTGARAKLSMGNCSRHCVRKPK